MTKRQVFPRTSNAVMNLGHFLTQTARRLPSAPALIRGDEVRSWLEMNQRVDALAHALKDRGVQKGDRVLVHSNNCLDMTEAMYAIFKTGAVLVPTNFRLGPNEILAMAEASEASFAIANGAFPDHVASIGQHLLTNDRLITIGDDFEHIIATYLPYGAFIEAEVDYNDPAWFFFTSGTTGTPKCAVLTHGHLAFVINNHAADLMPGLGKGDRSLVIAPLSHGAGLHFFVQVARGATSILMPSDSLDAEIAWSLIDQYKITNAFTVPTIVKRLVEHEAIDKYDHSSLKQIIYAGAPMYRADQKVALEKLGPVLVQYFGLGEVTGAITVLAADEHSLDDDKMRVGSCGYARTGMEIGILDDTGKQLVSGHTGQIAVRGPAVFAGYLNNKSANKTSFLNGWFVTGDIGHMDDAGYLYLTGRKSDMYISGGSNIYPREIEEKLLEHPCIAEVAIVGIPDLKWGEVGAAMISLQPNTTINEGELADWISDKIARYKQPKLLVFKSEIPKSAYGKIEKKRVRQMLLDEGYFEEIQ